MNRDNCDITCGRVDDLLEEISDLKAQLSEAKAQAEGLEKALVETLRVLRIDPTGFGGGSGYAHVVCAALNIGESALAAYRQKGVGK